MNSRLTVVLDGRATSPRFPGIARATLGLLHGLHELQHAHRIAVLSHGDNPAAELELWHDQRLVRVPTNAAPLSVAQQWQLPLVGRTFAPDIWHAPYYVRPLLGIPRPVVTVFDIIGRIIPGALPTLRARLLFDLTLRLSLRGAAHIITSSAATQRDLQRVYGIAPEAISVIPLAVDARFQPQSAAAVSALRLRLGLPREYVLYVGSNKPHKNLTVLIAAFAEVASGAALVVAGRRDPRFPEAQQLVQQLNLSHCVRFLPDIDDADLPALLSGALAFVFPSRYEGFGLPPLEAMACGAPVIAAATGALPEVVGDAGLLVLPEPGPLADALLQLLNDSALRERLRERGLRRASQFSWLETARQTVAVYQRLA